MKKYDEELTLKELQTLSDRDIDTSDIPELNDDFWKKAKLVRPEKKKPITIRLDPEVLSFFKKQGKGYQTMINNILKAYVDSHR